MQKKIGHILFVVVSFIFSCSQINYETRYKNLTWQEILETATNDEKKIDNFIFYSFVHYKKDIYSGGDGSDSFNEIKKLRDFYTLNDKHEIYVQIRLNVKSYYEAGPIKTELESLGCNIIKVYSGHNNFMEIGAWVCLDKIMDIARIDNVVVIKSFTPFFFR